LRLRRGRTGAGFGPDPDAVVIAGHAQTHRHAGVAQDARLDQRLIGADEARRARFLLDVAQVDVRGVA
jgi:hypothetical protein